MPEKNMMQFNDESIPVWTVQAVIVGSGAAGLNAAIHLYDAGGRDILILTEQWGGGTSNNSGSDKQTYYKLGIEGTGGDSPAAMAADLCNGAMPSLPQASRVREQLLWKGWIGDDPENSFGRRFVSSHICRWPTLHRSGGRGHL